ncbi:MAG TPA: hypothetical protein VH062_31125 [Polyangiaceae bacterium]|jgi:hypothetical protein|nr:hypothetical protein [Polyangiaceae bacterium]
MTAHGGAKTRTSAAALQTIGGIAAIAGGLLTQLSGAMHPVETATLFDPAVHLGEVAANPSWNLVYLGFTLGFVLLLVGFGAIAAAAEDGVSPWGTIARDVAIATTAVALVFFVVDGFATRVVAVAMVASGSSGPTVAAAGAIDAMGRAFFGHWTLLSWGVTPLLFGVAVARSARFKAWLGAVPLVSGSLGLLSGGIQAFGDFSLGLLPLFYGAVFLFDVWMVGMGVLLIRRARAGVTQESLSPGALSTS